MRLIRQWFDTSYPDSELAARYITLILWLIGSVYLMAFEWTKKPFDFVIFISTPVMWAVVIALPTLALFAFRNERYLASVLISISAIIGVIYTSTNNISRQSIQRDTNIENQEFNKKDRERLEKSLDRNERMLNEELKLKRNKCDKNPNFDCSQIELSLAVYEKAVKSDKADLKELGKPVSILAGENRLALFIATITNMDENDARSLVALAYPAIFGVFIELTALAVAIFGWHNYGFDKQHIYSSALSDKTFRIDVLEHQLRIAQNQNNQVDIRILSKQLDDAKDNLRKLLK